MSDQDGVENSGDEHGQTNARDGDEYWTEKLKRRTDSVNYRQRSVTITLKVIKIRIEVV